MEKSNTVNAKAEIRLTELTSLPYRSNAKFCMGFSQTFQQVHIMAAQTKQSLQYALGMVPSPIALAAPSGSLMIVTNITAPNLNAQVILSLDQ
jgi:hypothetical protein